MSHCKQLNTTSNWISPTPTHPLTLLHCQHVAKTQENLYTCTYTCHHPQGCLRFHSDWHLIALQTGCVLVYAHQLLLTQKNPKTSHAAQLYRSRSTAHHTRTTVCRANVTSLVSGSLCHLQCCCFFVLFISSMLKIPAVICLVTVVALPSWITFHTKYKLHITFTLQWFHFKWNKDFHLVTK